MSSTLVNVPTLSASMDDLRNLLNFVYKHETLLKQYGAIKIVPSTELKDILKKHRMNLKPAATIQQITKINRDDLTYSVTNLPWTAKTEPVQLSPMNESAFWLSLSQVATERQITTVSYMPAKSFFLKRVNRTDFNIHHLPVRSLLRFCNDNLLCQFVPTLIRTYGPGAVFPLSTARQRLFTFNYHHEGGIRHWYVIPASEREALERVFRHEQNSICIDHGHILIDPFMFEKYKIRYYRINQQPGTIVILAAGALSQSFTEDASWHETIDFAMPSWLDDGHANAPLSCSCRSDMIPYPSIINTHIFNRTLIQQYINANLSIVVDEKSPSKIDEQIVDVYDKSVYSDISFPSVDELSNQIIEFSASSNSSEGEQIVNNDYDQLFDMNIDSIPFIESSETPSSIRSYYPQTSWETINELSSPDDFYEEQMTTTPTTNGPSHLLSYEEILNILCSPPSTIRSIESQTEEPMDDQREIINSPIVHCQNNQKKFFHRKFPRPRNGTKNRFKNKIRDTNKTLLIFGMRNDVTKSDIYNHFVGCKKVTIKQSRLPPYLNYAFVVHRTSVEAEYNRKRPIDYRLFGPDCSVEYIKKNDDGSNKHQNTNKWNVVVRQIPENVTEESIRNLFSGSRSIMYIPARSVTKTKSKNTSTTENKLLWGYAFLCYPDPKEAASIVNNANRYKINNQPLIVSYLTPRNYDREQGKR